MTGFFGWLKGVPGEIWAGLGAVLVVLGIIARERHDAKMEERRKNREASQKTIDKIEEKSDAAIDQADRIRAANPITGVADSVSDRLPDYHYRD